MYVYYGTYHSRYGGGWAQLKVGQTGDIDQRKKSLLYRDCITVQDYVILPKGFNRLSNALFVESYLRMRLTQYALNHPTLGMYQSSTDYFDYKYRYWGIVENNFKHLFVKWANEAIEIMKKNA